MPRPRIEPTAADKQAVFEDLLRRNQIRRDAHLPVLDVKSTFVKDLDQLRLKNFELHLAPFLTKAIARTPRHPGFVGRIQQSTAARQVAERELANETGLTRPQNPPRPTFITAMSTRLE